MKFKTDSMKLVRLFVPERDNGGKAMPEVTDHVCETFAAITGGYSLLKVDGGYVMDDGVLCSERVNVIEGLVFAPSRLAPRVNDGLPAFVRLLAEYVKENMRQESVLVTVSDVQAAFV